MKVTTSCSGRFHIFDQARELARHGVLHQLINDYPKSSTRHWGIPDDKVVSLVANGVFGRMLRSRSCLIASGAHTALVKRHHNWFSRRVARYLSPGADVFIGLSSFCYEGILRAKKEGIVAIVDHGSLHMRTERRLLMEEADRWGFHLERTLPPDWVIEKEEHEFEEADAIFVLSNAAKRSMLENGIPEPKVLVNPCGVDLSCFQPGVKHDTQFRVMYCGALSARKGVHYLIRAFTELHLPHAELWLVGGNPKDTELLPFLSRMRGAAIKFFGPVPQETLPELYGYSSVFVLASIADGFGMVVSQAMACGLPVIVTENVGASDLIQDGVNGFIVPIRDIEILKDRLLRLYQNSDLCQEMGQAALETVRTGNSWADYGDRLVALLREIMGAARCG